MIILFSTQIYKPTVEAHHDNYFMDIFLERLTYYSRGLVVRLFDNIIQSDIIPVQKNSKSNYIDFINIKEHFQIP